MRIAILGAGFAGLGTALYLLRHSKGKVLIDLFDPQPIGGGVSGLSAGLLHPFPGRKAERIKNGDELLKATHILITEASQGISQPIVISNGILRPAITPLQLQTFQKSAKEYKEVSWWDKEKCEKTIPGLSLPKEGGGLYIKEGVTLDVKSYLEGLFQMGLRFGLQVHQRALTDEKEFAQFDKIVLASGMGIKRFLPLSQLPLSAVKGQALKLKWPINLPPLSHSLISDGYIVMERDLKSCIAGATFERHFQDEQPDLAVAEKAIKEKVLPFFPSLKDAEILDCKAGIRAIPMNHAPPMVGRVLRKFWFITGLGTKGLLYHGYLGDLLAQAILADDPTILPQEMLYKG